MPRVQIIVANQPNPNPRCDKKNRLAKRNNHSTLTLTLGDAILQASLDIHLHKNLKALNSLAHIIIVGE